MQGLKGAATLGMLWAYAAKYSGKLLVFLSTLILARLLLQEDFGVAGYALVVIAFLETLSGLGVGAALIYFKDEPAARDTAFVLILAAAGLLMLLAWLGAPLVGTFFQDPRAIPVTRVLALILPIAALGTVHMALLEKHLQFGRKFVPDLASAVTKAVTAVLLGYLNFGAWSLIFAQIAGAVVSTISVWIVLPWRPSLRFDRRHAQDQLSFGSKIIVVGLLGFAVANIGYFYIGRYFGAAVLGIYVLASRIPDVLVREIAIVINKVLFPVFAKIRDDPGRLGRGYLLTMRYLSIGAMPLGLGLSATAEPFVISLLGERWIEMIPVLRIMAIYMLLIALTFNSGTVYKAIGRPGLIIGLSCARLAILAPALLWVVLGPATLVAVAWVQLGAVVIHFLVSQVIVGRILSVPFARLAGALLPSAIAGTIMYGEVLLCIRLLDQTAPLLQLVVSTISGALVYCGAAWLMQRKLLESGYQQVRQMLTTRK